MAKVKIVRDHYNLLFTAGLAEAVQEAQRRAGSSAQLKGSATTNSISELSHRESLRVLTEVFKDTIERKDIPADYFFSADYCRAHGLSFSEAVFLKVSIRIFHLHRRASSANTDKHFPQPSLISMVVGNVASHIQRRYDQELAKRSATSSDSWVELLQATYGAASLIVSAAKRCEQDPSFSTDVGTIKQVSSLSSE